MKTCNLCQVEKPLDEFIRGNRGGDGFRNQCRVCNLDRLRIVREARRTKAAIEIAKAGGKACRKCRVTVPADQFGNRAASADGLDSWCRPCQRALAAEQYLDPEYRRRRCESVKRSYRKNPERAKAYSRQYTRDNPERVHASNVRLKDVHRTTGWARLLVWSARNKLKTARFGPSDLDIAYVEALFASQNGRCHWLGTPMVPSAAPRDPRRPSLDRLDNRLGYVRDNVVLTTMFANMGRSALDAQSFRAFVDELLCQLSRKFL